MCGVHVATENLSATLTRAAEAFVKGMEYKDNFDVNNLTNAEWTKDSIVFQLINKVQNKEMLAEMPHREFCDSSVIYRVGDKNGYVGAQRCTNP